MQAKNCSDSNGSMPVGRRKFLHAGLLVAGTPLLALLDGCAPGGTPQPPEQQAAAGTTEPRTTTRAAAGTTEAPTTMSTTTPTPPPPFVLEEATIADGQTAMAAGQISARQLVEQYLARIEQLDRAGPELRSILEVNPDALQIADALDEERGTKGPRGPLHGIPILLKDNIDTGDQMLTTAGSLALLGTRPPQDATVAKRLRDAGAVLLGKTNLSEWANFRSTQSSSGWSARGGQGRNPYLLSANPCGSSSGSAAAVAANLAIASLGTETDGSIVCPAHANGVVGLKPTVGLTSRAGVIPIAHSQDTVGPMARTVRDAAILLGVLAGIDPRDPATGESAGKVHTDYTQFLDADGLRGARIGVPRKVYFGYSPEADAIVEEAIRTMRELGATIVDPADIPTVNLIAGGRDEFTVLLYEFKADLAAYLQTRVADERHPDVRAMRSLADIIAFNEANKAEEMPYFGQEIFLMAVEKGDRDERGYTRALEASRRVSREKGLDAVMDEHKLDALVAPTGGPAWPIDLEQGDRHSGGSSSPAAMAGYPLISVPVGYVTGAPIGMTFMGRAFSEPMLLRLAYAFEQATKARRRPQFLSEQPAPETTPDATAVPDQPPPEP